MDEQPVLVVRGEAFLEVEAEIARIMVTITARDPDRARTMRLVDERAVAVDGLLARFSGAVEKVETSAVRVTPQLKSARPRERIAGYVAVVQQTVTVGRFDQLGELLAGLADQELTDVAGPWWALRPDTDVHRRARLEAVRDALDRARQYAGALGSELAGLVELADAGLMSQDQPMMYASAGPTRARQAVAPEEFTFDITPAVQTVRAGVEARFRITAPDLRRAPEE